MDNYVYRIFYGCGSLVCKRLALIIMLLVMTVATYAVSQKPRIGWDGFPYVAIALGYFEKDTKLIHEKTYEYFKRHVSAKKYMELAGGNKYRKKTQEDSRIFNNQLPFYAVKPLYPLVIAALYSIGIDPVDAALGVSNIAYFIFGIIVFLWISKRINPFVSVLFTINLVAWPIISTLARNSTPDMLSTTLLIFTLYLISVKDYRKVAMVGMLLSVAARPDNLIFVALFTVVFWWCNYYSLRVSAILMISAIVIYVLDSSLSGSYGWKVLFYHSFVSHLNEPQSFTPVLSFSEYVKIYAESLVSTLFKSHMSVFMLFAIIGAIARFNVSGVKDYLFSLLIFNVVYMVVHFMAFPGQKDRMFGAAYSLVILVLITIASSPLEVREQKNGDNQ